jgi:hypothetical protein
LDPVLAGLLGMVIIAAIIILTIIIRPEPTAEFIRGITKFKWGLKGIEIERDVNAVAEKYSRRHQFRGYTTSTRAFLQSGGERHWT